MKNIKFYAILLLSIGLLFGTCAQVIAAPAQDDSPFYYSDDWDVTYKEVKTDFCSSAFLKPGDCVFKSYGNGRLRIRTSPDISSNINIIANLEEGTRMTILSGPYCKNGLVFWRVQTEAGVIGYVAEGNQSERWLVLTTPLACSYTVPKTLSTQTPSPAKNCPLKDCACSNVKLGDYVKVSNSGTNALRSDPDLHPSDNIIYRAQPGTNLQIIGGPYCSYGWLVWKVRTDTGLEGFTPESNGSKWWLIPDESRNKNSIFQWYFPSQQWATPTVGWTYPWILPTSTPTPKPVINPTQHASGNCTLLSSYPSYLSNFPRNAETDFSWTIRNNSSGTWSTDNFDIAYIGGTNMLKYKDKIRQDMPYNVGPGGTLSFILDAVVPSTPGIYTMTYGIVQNFEIVCSVDVTVNVTW